MVGRLVDRLVGGFAPTKKTRVKVSRHVSNVRREVSDHPAEVSASLESAAVGAYVVAKWLSIGCEMVVLRCY